MADLGTLLTCSELDAAGVGQLLTSGHAPSAHTGDARGAAQALGDLLGHGGVVVGARLDDSMAFCGFTYSSFDSEQLGVRTAISSRVVRVGPPHGQQRRIERALLEELGRAAARRRIQLLRLRADAAEDATAAAAQLAGFRLVDVLLTFSRGTGDAPDVPMELARAEDAEALEAIAAAFRHSHNHMDPRIPDEAATSVYVAWIRNSLAGRADAVLVQRGAGGAVEGLITCVRRGLAPEGRPTTGIIELVGVRRESHGRGIGRRLVGAALCWFRSHGTDTVEVGTQATNVAAVRLYARMGFDVVSARNTWHLWLD